MRKLIISFVITVLIGSSLFSQITFEKTYGTEHWERGSSVFQVNDNGYIVGALQSPEQENNTYIIRTNMYGDTIWTRSISNDCWSNGPIKSIPVSDGFIVLSGNYDINLSKADINFFKLNMDGDIVWNKVYDYKNRANFPYDFLATSEGYTILVT